MARYIDADLLEKAIDEAQTSLETNDDKMWETNKPYYKGLCWARGLLNDQPTSDVAEVKHGEWDEVHVQHEGYGEIYYNHKECKISPDELYKCPFEHCPRCGAKMNGGDKL